MADNSTLPATGDIISTDVITTLNGGAVGTGEKAQRVKVGFGSDGVLRDVDASNGLPVSLASLPTLTKGTQGATGVSTQDLKDGGRVLWSAVTPPFVSLPFTNANTEFLLPMLPQRAGIEGGSSLTSFPVTAGKRLRLTSISAGLNTNTAATANGRFFLRINASGAATMTSTLILTLPLPSVAAVAGTGSMVTIPFPDGLEISGSQQIAVSGTFSQATSNISAFVSLVGFEY